MAPTYMGVGLWHLPTYPYPTKPEKRLTHKLTHTHSLTHFTSLLLSTQRQGFNFGEPVTRWH